jgi:hypothetical protein
MGELIDQTTCRQTDNSLASGPEVHDPDADWNARQERRFLEMSKALDSYGGLAHQDINKFLEALRSIDPPAGFAGKFAPHYLKELVDPRNCAAYPQQLRGVQLALLLSGLERHSGKAGVLEAWQQLSVEDQARLVDLASSEGLRFSSEHTPGLNVRDPMLVITESVARSGSSEQALSLIRAVDRHSQGIGFDNKFYGSRDHKPEAARAQALAEVFLAHDQAILSALTVNDDRIVEGQNNPLKTVSGENLAVLANLLRITALNPDNPRSAAVMEAVSGFTFAQIRTGNMGEWARSAARPDQATAEYNGKVDAHNRGVRDAIDRANKIAGVMHYAVVAGYGDLHADQAAQLAFRQKVGEFVIDTVFKYLPAGKFVGEEMGQSLSAALTGDSVFRVALRKSIGEVSKELAAQGETAVKGNFKELVRERLIQNLPAEYRHLERVKGDYNFFIRAITDAAVFDVDPQQSRTLIQEARSVPQH